MFQIRSHEHDFCREAPLLLSSSDVFSLRWQGRSVIRSWMPLTRLRGAPTNSCGICTSLNLIHLKPLWEQMSRPCPESHAPIFTHIHTRSLGRFPFYQVAGCPNTECLHLYHYSSITYLSLVCSLSALCSFSSQNSSSLPNSLSSFISHPTVEWYWEWHDMGVQFLSSAWCIINAYTHTDMLQQTWCVRLRSWLKFSGEASCLWQGSSRPTPAPAIPAYAHCCRHVCLWVWGFFFSHSKTLHVSTYSTNSTHYTV